MTLIDHNPKVASQEAGNKIRRYRIGFIAFFSLEVYILFETPLKNSVNEKLTIIASELRNALGISDQASQHLVGVGLTVICFTLAHFAGNAFMKLGNK